MDLEVRAAHDAAHEDRPGIGRGVAPRRPDPDRVEAPLSPTERRALIEETVWSIGLIASVLIVLALVVQLA